VRVKLRRRSWDERMFVCRMCWEAGFRSPVLACSTCQARRARKRSGGV
jgi:hypothetical protein